MNPFKNISIFRDQLCNCLPWGKDTKKEGPWQPRLDYRELNDDPELKPTPFPEQKQYDMEYKYLLQENDRLQHLVQCLVLQIGKTGDQKFPLKEIDRQMALFDNAVDNRPDMATIFPRKTL